MKTYVHLKTGLPVIEIEGRWFTYDRTIDGDGGVFIEGFEPMTAPRPSSYLLRDSSPVELERVLGIPWDRIVSELPTPQVA